MAALKNNFRRILLYTVLVLNVIALSLVFIFYQKDTPQASAWYSSSWLYRKAITVSNGGGALTNEDVLLTINTSALVTAGKLQADCDDLRFVDSNDTTALTYWIEGGCNTTTTQVWVRIPSVPTGSKIIYQYYGNTSATAGEAAWSSGKYITTSTGACPAGWTRETIYDGKFPYGSTTYGTTHNGYHSHSNASCTTGSAQGTLYNGADDGSPNCSIITAGHYHTGAQVAITSALIDPDHVGVYYCSNPKISHPASSLSMFNTTSASLPAGFTYYSGMLDRFPKGNNGFYATGGSYQHYHNTTGGYNTSAAVGSEDNDDCDNPTVSTTNHYHATVNGTTGYANNNVARYDLVFGQVSATQYGQTGEIGMFSAVPPLGWTRFTNLDGRFPRGAATAGGTYAGAAHGHTTTITTGGQSASSSAVYQIGGSKYALYTHTHSCAATVPDGTALPPYVTTIFAQRKTSLGSSTGTEQLYNTAPTAPTSLLTEGSTNPTMITDYTPELSAIYNDPDSGDIATSYAIIAGTDYGFINSFSSGSIPFDSGVVWTGGGTISVTSGQRVPDISYSGDPLQAGGAYYWKIKFTDNKGAAGPWSTTASFRVLDKPAAVTNVSGEALSTSTIRWHFTDNANSEVGFRVYDADTNTLMKTCVGVNLTYCDESGLSENTPYNRKIVAYNNEAESDPSTTVSRFTLLATPPTPTGTINSSSAITVRIPPSIGYDMEFYFECSSNCSGYVNQWIFSSSTEANNLLSNTPYTFRLKMRNGDQVETAFSSSVTLYTLGAIPTLTAGPLSSTSISLNASNVNHLADGQSGIYFECGTGCNSGIAEWIKTTSDVVIGLQPNTQYNFKVKMRNFDGVETDWSTTKSVYTQASPISISNVDTISEDTLAISINGFDNPSNTEISIQETTTGQFVNTTTNSLEATATWTPLSSTTGAIDVNGLSSGTTYSFKVKARNIDLVETTYSETVSATTNLADIIQQPPSTTDTTITWRISPSTDQTQGIKLYDTSNNLIKTCLGVNITSCIETGLTPNTAYTRKLTVFNDLSESAYSFPIEVLTLASQPSLLNIQQGEYTTNSVTLHIDPGANPSDTKYQIKETTTNKFFNVTSELLQTTPEETTFATFDQLGGQSGFTIYGLQPNTQYSFTVLARNNNLFPSAASSPRSVVTLAEQPVLVSVNAINTSTINIVVNSKSNPLTTQLILQEKNSSKYLNPTTGELQESATWESVSEWGGVNGVQVNGLTNNTSYSFWVKARNADLIETEYSQELTVITPISVPTLSLQSQSNTSVTLTASGIENLANGDSGVYFECTSTNCNSGITQWTKESTATVTDLLPNTTYSFRVKAKNIDGTESNWSSTSSIYTLATTPAFSETRALDFDSVSLTLDRKDNPNTTEISIQETSTGKYIDTSTKTLVNVIVWTQYSNIDQPLEVNGLTSGTLYNFQVKARNGNDIETSLSESTSVTTKLADINTQTPSSTVTEITWNISETSESIQGIKIYDTNGQLIKTCDGTAITSCTEAGLAPNTSYTRRISIFNNLTESALSAPISYKTKVNTPALQEIKEDSFTSNSVTVYINSNGNPEGTQYRIKEVSSNLYLNPTTKVLQSSADSSTLITDISKGSTINNLKPDTRYSFQVQAVNTEGIYSESQFSSEQNFTTLAQQPQIVSATAIDSTTLSLRIGILDNPLTTKLQVIEKISNRYINLSNSLLTTTSTWSEASIWNNKDGVFIKGLLPNTLYSFCIKAKNINDIETTCSQGINIYTKTSTPEISTRVVSSSSIELNLNLSSVTSTTQYQIQETKSNGYVDTNGRLTNTALFVPASTTRILLENLPANTAYSFKIRAKNPDGVLGEWSSIKSGTTWANIPSDLIFETAGGSTGKIKFNNNSNPNNTQYAILESSTGKYVDYTTNTLVNEIVWGSYISWGSSTGISLSGLEPGAKYSFRVKARNSENIETGYIDSNSGQTYSIIVNKPSDITTILSTDNNIDVSKIEGAQVGTQEVTVVKDRYLIAKVPISFDQNRDWSNAVVQSDPSNKKAVVKLNKTHGFNDKFTMYVVSGDSNAFKVCPDAESLDQVNATCSNSVQFVGPFPQTKEVESNAVTVSKAQIDGITYWIADGLRGTGGLGEVVDTRVVRRANVTETVSRAVEGVVTTTVDVLDKTPLGDLGDEQLTTVATTTTVVTVSVGVTSTVGGISQLGYGIAQLFINIFNTLGFRRKKYPSGYIYNAITREPIPQSIVRIFDTTHKLVTTAVTDVDGIFWCDIEDGEYILEARKRAFSFPSQLILGKEDYPMSNIYHGETTFLKKGELQIVIPLDPQDTSDSKAFLTLVRSLLSVILPVFNILLFITGIVVTIYVYSKDPSLTNLLIGLLYIPATVLLITSLLKLSKKSGEVLYTDKSAAQHISVLLRDTDFGKVVAKRVTDEKGRFTFEIKEKGNFVLEIQDSGIEIVEGNTAVSSKGKTTVRNKLIVRKI